MKTRISIFTLLACIAVAFAVISCADDVSDKDKNDTASDSDSGVPNDTGTGTPVDTGTGTPQDTGTSTQQDSESETAIDTETSIDTSTSTDVSTDTNSDSDTTVVAGELIIQAECAFDDFNNACLNVQEKISSSAIPEQLDCWGNTCPALASDGQLGYTNKGSWISIADVDLTNFSKVTLHYSSAEDSAGSIVTGFTMFVGGKSPEDGGTAVATIETNFTGSWTDYVDVTETLATAATGIQTVYFVAYQDGINNGNLDWIKFHN